MRVGVMLILLPMLLAACGQPPAAPPPPPGPVMDLNAYRAAAASGTAVFAVDPAASSIAVIVGRAGPMARLGHEHVVASHSLAGYLAPGLGRADLWFRLDQLSVDEPRLLHEAGIATQPSPQAVEGTRRNMLGPVLEAQRYPVVMLHAEGKAGSGMRLAITLHGVTRWLDLPATVQADAAQLSARGTALLKQSEFGMTPFSVGGGLLSVADELEVRYHIVGQRWKPPVSP